MTSMSTGYEQQGRVAQKQRTREALVAAARALVATGATPTVEDAAHESGISRTTAYRYFRSQAALLAEAHPETARTTLLPADPPQDPVERVALVVEEFLGVITSSEAQQRTMLRLSLESDDSLPLRQGRAIAWLEEALEPARPVLGAAGVHRLALAVRSVAGIESYVWLVDVGGLSRPDAVELMRENAAALCRDRLGDQRVQGGATSGSTS